MFDPFTIVVAIVFLTIVTVLVAAHELGHYLFARIFKMGVEEFSIGFGKKPIWIWKRRTYRTEEGETETTDFTVRPWPLGGFVRIKGMVPEEDGSEVRVKGGFYARPPWQRLIVLFAGPVFSLLAGWLVLIPVLTFYGLEDPLNEPVLGNLFKTMPAYQAGMRPDDRVLAIDGKPVKTWREMAARIQESKGEAQSFLVERENDHILLTVRPQLDEKPVPVLDDEFKPTTEVARQYRIGATYQRRLTPRTFPQALRESALLPFEMFVGLANLVRQPSRFESEVGGPASIVAATAASAREGVWPTVKLAGLLSMSLGIFNLLPIVPLDGGQMLVAFVEMLRRGRRLSFRVQNWVAGMGFALVMMLVLGVMTVDVKRFVPFGGAKDQPELAKPEK